MIARLGIAAPFLMAVPDSESFTVRAYLDSGCEVHIYPPMRSTEPLRADVPDAVEVNGKAAFFADLIRIDFVKDTFDRGEKGALDFDPPMEVISRAISSFCVRYRYVGRAPQVSPIPFPASTFRLEYLNDDGTPLEKEEGKSRARMGRGLQMAFVAMSPEIWEQIHTLAPDWQPPRWHDLLLDAQGALPRVGTAVVLAATALEVFIADTLDALAARGGVHPSLWEWINKRKDIDKNPAVEEQYDVLLKFFVGHSLKEDAALWTAFMNLKTARNKFVHEGAALVGGAEVTPQKAAELVGKARGITAKIREWLPPELQWSDFPEKTQTSMEIKLAERLRGRSNS